MGGIRPATGQQVPTLSNRAEASPRARVRAGLIGTGGVLDWWMIWDISIYHFTHTYIYINCNITGKIYRNIRNLKWRYSLNLWLIDWVGDGWFPLFHGVLTVVAVVTGCCFLATIRPELSWCPEVGEPQNHPIYLGHFQGESNGFGVPQVPQLQEPLRGH